MNTFKLEIKNESSNQEPDYYIKLIIDEYEFLTEIDEDFNDVYFEALMNSTKKSGKYLIFTCSCGIADCGGWDYVKVTHLNNLIIWDFEYEKKYHFEFSKEYYKKEIERMNLEIINNNVKIEPQFVVEPE